MVNPLYTQAPHEGSDAISSVRNSLTNQGAHLPVAATSEILHAKRIDSGDNTHRRFQVWSGPICSNQSVGLAWFSAFASVCLPSVDNSQALTRNCVVHWLTWLPSMALNSALGVRHLLIDGHLLQERCRASENNNGRCPKKNSPHQTIQALLTSKPSNSKTPKTRQRVEQ